MKKFWFGLLAVLVVAAGGYGWTRWQGSQVVVAPTTVAVERGTVEQTVLASGVIEASSLVSVGSRVSGQVETLAVTLGQEVKEGDLIAQIDSLSQQNDVLQAEADLAQIEADILAKNASIREAELTLERNQQLSERRLSSTGDLEAAEAALAVARAGLISLEAQKQRAEVTISNARLELARTKITAPIDGTVVAVVTSEGQTVNAGMDTPTIVKLANLERMVVKADVSEADVIRVEPGQVVGFTLLGEPDMTFEAVVRDVEPAPASIKESDEISTDTAIYYKGLFDVENPDRKLRIGMTAQVSIQIAEAKDVLTVLSSVLGARDEEGAYAVRVYDPATGQTEERSVTVGLNNNITAEVTSGLAEGERVIADAAAPGAAAGGSRRGGPRMMGF
ncbi:efflux RND transporter periplasmic adaptor subunit [Cereibacter changlensis]|uniref:Efflux RND transporter periplasmic adaptor subunit n=1 Tax=Cereibacter changlensis TaxID=402884 RepID=A0A4U0Z0E0_9RHOB|nr:efflux RND transporter periplasmic adaptor subunit [Cereibacter changlensis]TKA96739.1 efflux RND transporter periplasmic adaptor subunit [Cereibacter changlensis]